MMIRRGVSQLAFAFTTVFNEGPYFLQAEVLGIALIFAYMILLPSLVIGRVTFQALEFLTPVEFVFAILMGSLLSLVIVMNVFALRKIRTCRRRTGAISLLASILPNSLCCTTIIPSVIGLLAPSTAVLFTLSPAIQAFLVRYAVSFYAASAVLLIYSLQLIAREVAEALPRKNKQSNLRYVSLRC